MTEFECDLTAILLQWDGYIDALSEDVQITDELKFQGTLNLPSILDLVIFYCLFSEIASTPSSSLRIVKLITNEALKDICFR